jgi:hypothetical protein
MLKQADLPLEGVILLIAGMTLLITGVLLFPVATGALAYYEDGLYGVLLVMFAVQMIALGKTPFGDLRTSKLPLVVGVVIAAVGIVTGLIPELLGELPRYALFVCFGPGGLLLLLQMIIDKQKLRAWARYGGVFRHLIAACTCVYALSMLIGGLILFPGLLTTTLTATVALLYGAAIVYLALVLRVVYVRYPEAAKPPEGDAALPIDKAMLLLMGVFMLLLGLLLIPVSRGELPFAGSAQLGLLMIIFAIQMVASGSTPLGPFRRSWLIVGCGLVFAALGIVSCIVPDVLVPVLTYLVGALNALGGAIALAKSFLLRLSGRGVPREPRSPLLVRLVAATVLMNALTIVFGITMFFSGLLPPAAVGAVLAANGCVLLYLLHILVVLDRVQGDGEVAV